MKEKDKDHQAYLGLEKRDYAQGVRNAIEMRIKPVSAYFRMRLSQAIHKDAIELGIIIEKETEE